MNKSNLIDVVRESAGLKKNEAELAVNATLEAIKNALAEGDNVQLVGFGTFEVKTSKERSGKNPQTGETIVIPAGKRVGFKAGKALKDAL